MRILCIVYVVSTTSVAAPNTASCLQNVCQEELTDCSHRGDCATLFTCVGEGDCDKQFATDSSVGRCLARCGNATTEADDDLFSRNFRQFWETRNAVAEKKLRSFKPAIMDFSFPEIKSDQSAPSLRRRLLSNTKNRLLNVVDQLADIAARGGAETTSPTAALIETDKSTFQGFRELREKIERDVDGLLINL